MTLIAVSFVYEKRKKSNLDTNEVAKIIGGTYSDDINISESAMYISENGCDFGVPEIPTSKGTGAPNSIIMGRLKVAPSTVNKFSQHEYESISRQEISKRVGPAFGHTTLSGTSFAHDQKSFTHVTHNKTRILFKNQTSSGTYISVTYKNSASEIKRYNSVYNDGFMKQLTKKQKYNMLMKSPLYCEIIIEEIISQIKTMTTMIYCDLVPDSKLDSFF